MGAWETESGVWLVEVRWMSSSGFGKFDGGGPCCGRDGDGPAVVLIHGGVFWDLQTWDPQGASAGQNGERRA